MRKSLFRCRLVPSVIFATTLFVAASAAGANEPSRARDNQKAPVTFAKDVSRILQNRCQTCHHAGTAAPFTLATFDDAVKRADTIREVVTEKRMPPWHADPRF